MATVTAHAYSNRIIVDHNTKATVTAIAMETMAHGLYISQAGVPLSAAARPPIQNHPGG